MLNPHPNSSVFLLKRLTSVHESGVSLGLSIVNSLDAQLTVNLAQMFVYPKYFLLYPLEFAMEPLCITPAMLLKHVLHDTTLFAAIRRPMALSVHNK